MIAGFNYLMCWLLLKTSDGENCRVVDVVISLSLSRFFFALLLSVVDFHDTVLENADSIATEGMGGAHRERACGGRA